MSAIGQALNNWLQRQQNISAMRQNELLAPITEEGELYGYGRLAETITMPISIMFDDIGNISDNIRIERVWALPSRNTFLIPPIAKLLNEEVDETKLWIDPFAGYNSPATITNDLNPGIEANYHMEAIDFLRMFKDASVDGVLYDPPYSSAQVTLKYQKVGAELFKGKGAIMRIPAMLKNEIARIIKPGGKAICFGWTSMGLGKKRGFRMDRILLVTHGGSHNDTIVTVEMKTGSA